MNLILFFSFSLYQVNKPVALAVKVALVAKVVTVVNNQATVPNKVVSLVVTPVNNLVTVANKDSAKVALPVNKDSVVPKDTVLLREDTEGECFTAFFPFSLSRFPALGGLGLLCYSGFC